MNLGCGRTKNESSRMRPFESIVTFVPVTNLVLFTFPGGGDEDTKYGRPVGVCLPHCFQKNQSINGKRKTVGNLIWLEAV